MSRLELGTIIQEGFKDLNTKDPYEAGDVLSRLSDNLGQLDKAGQLEYDALKELVWAQSTPQAHIQEVVNTSLSGEFSVRGMSTPLFEKGASSVVLKADGSEFLAVYHNPNASPELEATGNPLRWALVHAAYAAISGAQGWFSPTVPEGYLAVENAIRISKGNAPVKRISDVPPKLRHHLGGDWMTDRPTQEDAIGPVVAGTSGILFSQPFLDQVKAWQSTSDFSGSYNRANAEGLLEGFDGNFLAGLNDAKVSRNLLGSLFKGRSYPVDPGLMMDMENGLDWLNLH